MLTRYLPVVFLLCTVFANAQTDITRILTRACGENPVQGELSPADTTIDVRNGYLAYKTAKGKDQISLLEAVLFRNDDGTQMLAVVRYEWDMQCGFFKNSFYEYNPKTDSIRELQQTKIMPELAYSECFTSKNVTKTASKYLDSIRAKYLGNEASVYTVLEEIYSFRLLLHRDKKQTAVTLHVCDYIPVNAVSIKPKDWEVFEKKFKPLSLVYDSKQKRFVKHHAKFVLSI